ncbi:MAG: Bax inhibitor-1/YccA family protein [Actinomycetota bacterium]
MRTSNPVLSDSAIDRVVDELEVPDDTRSLTERFTIIGVIQRSVLLIGLVVVGGWVGWNMVTVDEGVVTGFPTWIMPAALGLIALAFLTFFRPQLAPVTAPIWAVGEGVLVGAISRVYEVEFDGIVLQAFMATVLTAFATLAAYRSGRIRATPQFRKIVIIATMGVMALYLVNLGIALFGGGGIGLITDSGPIGIAFSLFVVGLAAMNLVLDFDLIERGEAEAWPAKMMWFAAFALVVTLVWLYLELLRLLAKLRD